MAIRTIISVFVLCSFLSAGTYYVSPTGSAPWSGAGNCTSSATPCLLATANTNAAAGDTVYLRGGTYSTAINPTNSGTGISSRISFMAYTGETPTITTSGTDVELDNDSYIRISGITIAETAFVTPIRIENGTHHIEFDHNTVSNTGQPKYLLWLSGRGSSCPAPSGSGSACLWVTHVWIHDNTFTGTGSAGGGTGCTNDGYDLVKIGEQIAGSGGEEDNYNTIENNVIVHGGHGSLATWGRFEVYRNNIVRNEPWSSGCANHTLPTYNTYTYGNSEVISGTGAITFQEPNLTAYNGSFGHRSFDSEDFWGRWMYNLIEGNRFGHSGVNPDNDGAESVTLGIPQTIFRYNVVYAGMSAGVMLKYDAHKVSSSGYGGTYNRLYNNTIIQSGYGYPTALTAGGAYDGTAPWGESAVAVYCSSQKGNCSSYTSAEGNILKNNIFRLSAGYSKFGSDVLVKSGGNNAWSEFTSGNVGNNWCTSTQASSGGCSTSGDPLFTNPDVSNPASTTLPDITLQPSSSAINGGTWLTTTTNGGSGSTNMTVSDAMYFQDGTWGSDLSRASAGLGGTLQADWICVGIVSNCAQISSVTYGTYSAPAGTLTLASSLSWNVADPVWLYKRSDGTVVLSGSAPDYGASEVINRSGSVTASVSCTPVVSITQSASKGSVKICRPASSSGGFNCGPPSYTCGEGTRTVFSPAHVDVGANTCNWTSLTTLATCGNLTGQNTIVAPGTFGSQRIMRLTDQTTSSTFSVLTADDGLPTLFNLDSTGIIVKRSGGFRYLFHFNPTTMQTTGVSAVSLDNAGTTYSRTINNVVYQLTGTDGVTIKKTTVTMAADPANDTSSTVTIKDLGTDANCFGAAFSATSVSLLLAPGGADKVFTVGASTGIQNTGTVVVSYNVDTGQCTTVDTSNGQVTQNGTLLGTYDASNGAMRGTWHEAYQSPNARYALIVMLGISGPFIWDLQNPLSLVHCPTSGAYYCDGHDIWGNAGLIRGKSLIYHSYANPDVPQRINLPSPPAYPDMHPSWNNDYASDDSTWFLTKAQDATIDATPLVSPVAFYNEMWMTKPDGSNTISRQCHTFSSGQAKEFDSSNALASISPDGRFAAFTSDWEGSLGSLGGSTTCVLGATDSTGCRSDVFVCELK